jgi:hypothetical protein
LKHYLFDLFDGKCAYCESLVRHADYGEVEHFRPKAEVTEADGHPGYIWLAFEESNLLPACGLCNGPSHKANHFPLRDETCRARPESPDTGGECPLLLCPYASDKEDEIEVHVRFAPETGAVDGITDEGKKTIEVLGLQRHELVEVRRMAQRDAIQKLGLAYLKALTERDSKSLAAVWDDIRTGRAPFSASVFVHIRSRVDGISPYLREMVGGDNNRKG